MQTTHECVLWTNGRGNCFAVSVRQ